MFVKIGIPHQITLIVEDSEGNKISSDTPFITIRNMDTNCYFNGIEWVNSLAEMQMLNIGEGIYKSEFTPNEVGRFEIHAYSVTYPSEAKYTIDVYSDVPRYVWKAGTEFEVVYVKHALEELPEVLIRKNATGQFYNGEAWIDEETYIDMRPMQNNILVTTFIPDEEGEYTVEIHAEPSLPKLFFIDAMNTVDTMPITITNYNFRSQDGSDSTVMDEKGFPIKNAKISLYDMATKERVYECFTDSNGGWSVNVRPAKYMFLFERDGYASLSFERTVL